MTAPTDQELSALVAEKVMGWTWDQTLRHWRTNGTSRKRFCMVARFAADPGLALEAALKARGGLDLWIIPQSNGTTLVAISLRDDGYTRDVDLVGSTVARALCFAALRAVGVDVQDDSWGER